MNNFGIPELIKELPRVISDNSPAILTAIGVTGTVSTAYLTGKASFKAAYVLESELPDATFKDHVKRVWKFYIPAAATGIATIACIVGANNISSKRNAALIGAYSLTERAFRDYKEEVVALVGEKKEHLVQEAAAKKKMDETPVSNSEIYIFGAHEQLCFDTMSGRYFKSDMETIRKSINFVNSQIISNMYASVNDFYAWLGLPPTTFGEEAGWTVDSLLNVSFTAHLAENGTPCIAINYLTKPKRDYWKIG